jgi:hypothetical protein
MTNCCLKVRHEYRTIVLPRLEEQQYDNTPPPTVIAPQTQPNSLKELWYAIVLAGKIWRGGSELTEQGERCLREGGLT